jgi:hypothetical protein
MNPTTKRAIIACGSICIAIVNIAFKINNANEYKHHISSPEYLRDLYRKYYYKYDNDNQCFPSTICYEFVIDKINGQRIKQWYSEEPVRECTLTDWKTADSNVCHSLGNEYGGNMFDALVICIVVDVVVIIGVIMSIWSDNKLFGYTICVQSINNIFGFIINAIVLATTVINNGLIAILLIWSMTSWIIAFIIVLWLECAPCYIRLVEPSTQPQPQQVIPLPEVPAEADADAEPLPVEPNVEYINQQNNMINNQPQYNNNNNNDNDNDNDYHDDDDEYWDDEIRPNNVNVNVNNHIELQHIDNQ